MSKECLFYNGEFGAYELLDFDPNGLSNEEIKEKAKEKLKRIFNFDEEELEKALETVYLIDVENLEHVKS